MSRRLADAKNCNVVQRAAAHPLFLRVHEVGLSGQPEQGTQSTRMKPFRRLATWTSLLSRASSLSYTFLFPNHFVLRWLSKSCDLSSIEDLELRAVGIDRIIFPDVCRIQKLTLSNSHVDNIEEILPKLSTLILMKIEMSAFEWVRLLNACNRLQNLSMQRCSFSHFHPVHGSGSKINFDEVLHLELMDLDQRLCWLLAGYADFPQCHTLSLSFMSDMAMFLSPLLHRLDHVTTLQIDSTSQREVRQTLDQLVFMTSPSTHIPRGPAAYTTVFPTLLNLELVDFPHIYKTMDRSSHNRELERRTYTYEDAGAQSIELFLDARSVERLKTDFQQEPLVWRLQRLRLRCTPPSAKKLAWLRDRVQRIEFDFS